MPDTPWNDEACRRHFPALATDWALFDNAGGSVPLAGVADAVSHYLRTYGVQLGASYPLSLEAAKRVRAGHVAIERLLGASSGEVFIGPSTSHNLRLLAQNLRPNWQTGDEVIVTHLDHEANIGPWRQLETTGIRVHAWHLHPDTGRLELDDLLPLLNDRTRLIAVTHCSNVTGRIHDIKAITRVAHDAGALVCVDGVAFAPHRQVDVYNLGVDFYAISLYKTFGPHLGALWGRRELLEAAASPNHYFIADDDLPYKFELGGVNHELVSALPAIIDYLLSIGAGQIAGQACLERAWHRIARREEALVAPLLDYLGSRSDIRIVGEPTADGHARVPTVSFVAKGHRSSSIPPHLEAHKIAIRWGDFYARRAIEALGLAGSDGVIRVSMVHYNTADEVARLIDALDRTLRIKTTSVAGSLAG